MGCGDILQPETELGQIEEEAGGTLEKSGRWFSTCKQGLEEAGSRPVGAVNCSITSPPPEVVN